eukprot:GHVS01010350.1.p1 GENE.GHVS01010350.1~~GHVS01010350.1.p1  ORF type:complete len:339 (+),score=79.32 GHVS01010350.1:159-1175(+)
MPPQLPPPPSSCPRSLFGFVLGCSSHEFPPPPTERIDLEVFVDLRCPFSGKLYQTLYQLFCEEEEEEEAASKSGAASNGGDKDSSSTTNNGDAGSSQCYSFSHPTPRSVCRVIVYVYPQPFHFLSSLLNMSVVAAAQVLRGRDRREQKSNEVFGGLAGPDVCEEEMAVRYLSEDSTLLKEMEEGEAEAQSDRCSESGGKQQAAAQVQCNSKCETPATTTTSISIYIKRLFDCLDVFTDVALADRTYTDIVLLLQDKVDFPFSASEKESFAHKLTLGTAEHAVMLQELKLHLRCALQFMYLCIHVYLCVHMYMCVCTNTYMFVFGGTHMQVRMYICYLV